MTLKHKGGRKETIKRFISLLEYKSQGKINQIPLTDNTTKDHWWACTELARELFEQQMKVILEAKFKGGGRADLFLPEIGVILEVLHSETVEDLRKKVNKHYAGLPVRVIYVTTEEVKRLGAQVAVEQAFARLGEVIVNG